MSRIIMHFDLDAFFASVEQLDNPEYRGKALIVGGVSDRGVVSTCSYEARKYGIRSGMSSYKARKLCPNGIFIRGSHSRYREVSRNVFSILERYGDAMEKMSIDEAYIEFKDCQKSPVEIAREIKAKVLEETGLTISVGISYNKFLAKLASDWNKPDGLKVITNKMVPHILYDLPISKVHGLGKKSVDKLNRIGIFYIRDLYKYDKSFFEQYMGKWGLEIYHRIRGIDKRKVEGRHERKSIGTERTFKTDLESMEDIRNIIHGFCDQLIEDINKKDVLIKTVSVKIKYYDFTNISRSNSFTNYTRNEDLIRQMVDEVLKEVKMDKKIRLAGLTFSNIIEGEEEQMSLF